MKKVFLFIAPLFSLIFFLTPVLAEQGHSGSNNQEVENEINEMQHDRQARIASRSADRKEKLDAIKLKVCETKKDNIIRRSQSAANRAAVQFRNFTSIAGRVDQFYTDKVLTRGITVASYSALKADISLKQALAQTAVNDASASAQAIDCSSTNPKGQIQNFNDDMKAVISALKNYRTSIRNFIVAIKSAIGKSTSASSSASQGD